MSDNSRALFTTWAAPDAVWSRWAKPAIFAQLNLLNDTGHPDLDPLEPTQSFDLTKVPDAFSNTAIVVSLPGSQSVKVGLALAKYGYRPVPLYNVSGEGNMLVPIKPILRALAAGKSDLDQLVIDRTTPPAFLIDSARLQGNPTPGAFDNRWIVFPQDFPSAIFLQSQGIRQVFVIRAQGGPPQADLEQVLGLWQKGGLEIWGVNIENAAASDAGVPQTDVLMPAPQRLNLLPFVVWRTWSRISLISAFKLRRSSAGGFGSRIPYPSSSG